MGHLTRLGLIVRARGLGERFGRVDLPLRLRAMSLAMATKNRVRPPLVQIVSINYRSINHVA